MAESKGITGNTLKMIAIITMLLDHIGASLALPRLQSAGIAAGVTAWDMGSLMSACPNQAFPYYALRLIGRIAFPIFCFLLVEGFLHTRNLKKYCIRLAVFALISEIPFDLAFHRTAYYPNSQNVFFTLLIGLLTIWGIHSAETAFSGKKVQQAFCRLIILLIGMCAAWYLKTDYDYMGILIIVILYELRTKRMASAFLACLFLCYLSSLEISAFAAIPFIQSYNGRRGNASFPPKYFFYWFYPIHLLLLYLIGRYVILW